MHHCPLCPAQRLKTAGNQVGTRLSQHLDTHVFGDALLFDEAAHKIIVRLRGGGKTHFDFPKADFEQQIE